MTDEELREYDWCNLVEFTLKYQKIRDFGTFLDEFFSKLRYIETQGAAGVSLGKVVLQYIISGAPAENIDLFKQKANNYLHAELRGEAMTLAQAFERRGIEIGLQQGMQKGIEKGIQKGEVYLLIRLLERKFGRLPVQYKERIEEANPETLLAWGEKILDANSLREIFNN